MYIHTYLNQNSKQNFGVYIVYKYHKYHNTSLEGTPDKGYGQLHFVIVKWITKLHAQCFIEITISN